MRCRQRSCSALAELDEMEHKTVRPSWLLFLTLLSAALTIASALSAERVIPIRLVDSAREAGITLLNIAGY